MRGFMRNFPIVRSLLVLAILAFVATHLSNLSTADAQTIGPSLKARILTEAAPKWRAYPGFARTLQGSLKEITRSQYGKNNNESIESFSINNSNNKTTN